MIIEGNVSVKAALMGGRRQVEKIYVDEAKHGKHCFSAECKNQEMDIAP